MKAIRVFFGVLILTIIFSIGVSAWAGESWDKISMGAKSTFGDIVGLASPDTGTYIKTTNFGVGQKIGKAIDNPAATLKGAGQSAVSGASAFKASLASIPSGAKTSFNLGGNSFKEGVNSIYAQLSNFSNKVGTYTGLWGTKPQETDFERMKRQLPYGAYIMSKTEVIKTTTKSNEPNIFSANQSPAVFQNDSALSNALKTIGTNISQVTAIKGDIYNSDGSLAEKNALIAGRGPNGSFNKNNNLSGKIIDVKSVQSSNY